MIGIFFFTFSYSHNNCAGTSIRTENRNYRINAGQGKLIINFRPKLSGIHCRQFLTGNLVNIIIRFVTLIIQQINPEFIISCVYFFIKRGYREINMIIIVTVNNCVVCFTTAILPVFNTLFKKFNQKDACDAFRTIYADYRLFIIINIKEFISKCHHRVFCNDQLMIFKYPNGPGVIDIFSGQYINALFSNVQVIQVPGNIAFLHIILIDFMIEFGSFIITVSDVYCKVALIRRIDVNNRIFIIITFNRLGNYRVKTILLIRRIS